MAFRLKYNTESYVMLGPMMGVEGTTLMTGLTMLTSDIRFHKMGSTTLIGKSVDGVTEVSAGYYLATLLTTDVDVYGSMEIYAKTTETLVTRLETMIMNANAYDALMAADGTGSIETDIVSISGDSVAADTLEAMCDGSTTGAVVTDGSNTSATFKTGLSETTNNTYEGAILWFTSGALQGESKTVTAYNGTTKFITVAGGFTGTPADAVTFIIV